MNEPLYTIDAAAAIATDGLLDDIDRFASDNYRPKAQIA
jgi:hypothetical protein